MLRSHPAAQSPRSSTEDVGGGAGVELCPMEVVDLTVRHGDRLAVDDVSFRLPSGKLTALVGPNGAGKSTILRAALGLTPSTAGAVRFFGKPLREARQNVAFLPQRESSELDFPVRAIDVVAMGLYRQIGWIRPIRRRHRESAMAALDRVGMADDALQPIGELSGGQQKRVFLARTLVQQAPLIIMDEPFAGVDAASEAVILNELRLLRAAGSTVVVVHHDLDVVRESFDHCILINQRLVAQGAVDDVVTVRQISAAYDGMVPLTMLRTPDGGRRQR